jgi:hypothetical protein
VEPDEPGDAEAAVAGLVLFPQPARSRVSPTPRAVQRVDCMLDLMTRIIIGMILIAKGVSNRSQILSKTRDKDVARTRTYVRFFFVPAVSASHVAA